MIGLERASMSLLIALSIPLTSASAWSETVCVKGDRNGNISVIDGKVTTGTVVSKNTGLPCPSDTVTMALDGDDAARKTGKTRPDKEKKRGSTGIIIGDGNSMVIIDE